MVKFLTNRVICIAFAILGGFVASAEGVREDLKDDNGNVVGYKVTGLGKNENETAIVFTTSGVDIPWTVPANLQNVQFLVVGGGGGGSATFGSGGGGGGVVTGIVSKVSKGSPLIVRVGKGGSGGAYGTKNNPGTDGHRSCISISAVDLIIAYGGGGGRISEFGLEIGSGAGGWAQGSSSNPVVVSGKSKGNIGVIKSHEDFVIANSVFLGNNGGDGNLGVNGIPNSSGSAGGGGANEPGKPSEGHGNTYAKGGNGGQGVNVSITGDLLVYGSGGGGGGYNNEYVKNGKGGDGAGSGGRFDNLDTTDNDDRYATDGIANRGGGGGGGGRGGNSGTGQTSAGGDGGSGIVVLRYKEPNTSGFKVIVR